MMIFAAAPTSRGIYLREASACQQPTEVQALLNLMLIIIVKNMHAYMW